MCENTYIYIYIYNVHPRTIKPLRTINPPLPEPQKLYSKIRAKYSAGGEQNLEPELKNPGNPKNCPRKTFGLKNKQEQKPSRQGRPGQPPSPHFTAHSPPTPEL